MVRIRIDKVVTKRGDDGSTDLASGERAPKDSARIEGYGAVDEANCAIGMARELLLLEEPGEARTEMEAILLRVQNHLFNLGSELATTAGKLRPDQPVIADRHVAALEEAVLRFNEGLPALPSFVLPGGGTLGAALHVARSTVRRAERAVVRLSREEPVGRPARIYLNRLSDLLFVLGRYATVRFGKAELLWNPEEA
ncbi:MAG: cob(I)yrinic acid a,c-diamide adenosyltransferase [Deltaproteobacteria bacterium]|nr:cob(I)yrinic acid a,c-diamide adenosyltransferase [Deltaproteobacteria bacterium]